MSVEKTHTQIGEDLQTKAGDSTAREPNQPVKFPSNSEDAHLSELLEDLEPKKAPPFWYPDGTPRNVKIAAGMGTGLLIGTLVLAGVAWWIQGLLPLLYLLLVVWVILPPTLFWYEYHQLLVEKLTDAQFERYKYGVQLGAAIWAGVVVFLVAYVTSDHFKSKESSTNNLIVTSSPQHQDKKENK